MKRALRIGFYVAALMTAVTGWGTLRYVDSSAAGSGNGSSWENAFTNLGMAIAASANNDELWIAAGTYCPTGTDRTATFQLKTGLRLYGGFTSGMATKEERNGTANPTILSGDIGTAGVTTDNAYHVLRGANNAVLDGLTVCLGRATATSGGNDRGGGMHMSDSAVTVVDCIFSNNNATYYGSAVLQQGASTLTASNTLFVTNTIEAVGSPSGGAITVMGGALSVTRCEFLRNVSAQYAPAAMVYSYTSALIRDSLFRENRAASDGGAVKLEGLTTVVSNCLFLANVAGAYGGAVSMNGGRIDSCTFVRNQMNNRGGGVYAVGAATVTKCLFSDNYRKPGSAGCGAGGGFDGNALVENCTFAGGDAYHGGGLYLYAGTALIRNCVVAGNVIPYYGAGISVWSSARAMIDNCTVTRNAGTDAGEGWGGGLFTMNGMARLTNVVIWGNYARNNGAEIYSYNQTSTGSYCDIQGGWNGSRVYNRAPTGYFADGGSNLNVDPLFAPAATGGWDTAAVYDPIWCQTTLTDTNASWTADAWAGLLLNPNTNQWRHYIVASNSPTRVVIWGDASTIGATNVFRFLDVHLQSVTGRWTPRGWVADASFSPLIDKGDPAYPFSREPAPNGGRINMGADGNTAYASKSLYVAPGTVMQVR